MRWIEIDQDYLCTGTAIGSCASHGHYLRFLVFVCPIWARLDWKTKCTK